MKKRVLSLFVSLVMVISLVGVLPVTEVSASNTANDLVSIAESQLGNGYSKYSKYPSAWCADFVSWCARQSGVTSIPSTASCKNQYDGMKNNGCKEVSNPQKGDIVFFYCTKCSGVANKWCHVGIMINSTTSIDGNYGGKVAYDKSYSHYGSLGYKHSSGITKKYVRPNYETSSPNPPSNLSISTDKAYYKVGETVTFSFTSNDSAELYIPIDYNGVRSEFINVSGRTSYTCTFSQPGWYGFFLYAKNSSGESSTVGDYKNIRVDNTAPSDFSISTDKKIYYAGENVLFSYNSINAAELYIPIDVNGTREHFIDVSSKTSYSRSFTATGVYYYTLYGRNAVGECGAQYNPFYVFNKPNLGDEFYAKIKVKAEPEFLLSNVSDDLILQFEDNNKSLEQTWKFKKNSDGSFCITSLSTGNAIDLENWTDADGANVALHKYANTTNQNWNIYEIGKNVYSFKPQCSNMRVLDVPFEKFENGTSIKMHEFLGSAAQKFTIEKVSCPHNYTSKVIESATCTTDGLQIRTCLICGETETQTVPATGHNYTSKVIAPTLIEQGYTLHTCSVCGDSYKDNYVSSLCETQLKYQLAKLANGTYAVRFVFAVDEEEAIAAKKASIYLTTKDGTNTKETSFNTAYRSIYAGGKLVSAGEGKVFLTAKYVNIPEEELNLLATLNFDGDIYKRNVQI